MLYRTYRRFGIVGHLKKDKMRWDSHDRVSWNSHSKDNNLNFNYPTHKKYSSALIFIIIAS